LWLKAKWANYGKIREKQRGEANFDRIYRMQDSAWRGVSASTHLKYNQARVRQHQAAISKKSFKNP
jgi:hypothetical protein